MAMMEKSCRDYVGVLAAKVSVPGGGGAAALCGAIGMALSTMVGNFTVGKKKYADVEDEVKTLIEKGGELQDAFMALSEKDAEVFGPLSAAYGLPQNTEEEKAAKAVTLEREAKNASEVPMDIMRNAKVALEVHKRMGEIGSVMLVSDVGCGTAILRAAMEAARLNVIINLGIIQDQAYIAAIRKEMNELMDAGNALADEIQKKIVLPKLGE